MIDSMVRNAMCNAASAFGLATSNDAIIDNSIEKKIFDVKSEETLAECHEKLMDNLKIDDVVVSDDICRAFMSRNPYVRSLDRSEENVVAAKIFRKVVVSSFPFGEPVDDVDNVVGEIDHRVTDLVMFTQKTEFVLQQILDYGRKLTIEKVRALLDAGLTEEYMLKCIGIVMESAKKKRKEAEASCQG